MWAFYSEWAPACRSITVSPIRRAVLRTLATGAFLAAVVPPAAVIATQPRPEKTIVLKVSLTPAASADDPSLSAPR
jgi:hypothetical protein